MPIKYRAAAPAPSLTRLNQEFGNLLPSNYLDFLASHNGLTIAAPGWCQIPFDKVDDGEIAFAELFGVDLASSSDLSAFNQEFVAEIAFVGMAIVVGEDGGGNPYVLALDRGAGRVLYWDRTHTHVASKGRMDIPEVDDSGNLYVVAEGFDGLLDLVKTNAT